MTEIQHVRDTITYGRYGAVYFSNSFPEIDSEYMGKILRDLEREGVVIRLAKGIYVKVKKTQFGICYPTVDNIVEAIAERDKAEVIPTGITAANRLGFTTQVPMKSEFLTTGSDRTLTIGKKKIKLKHGAPKNFAYNDRLLRDMVQALRSIGQKNILPSHRERVHQLLVGYTLDKAKAEDLKTMPVWMSKLIKENSAL